MGGDGERPCPEQSREVVRWLKRAILWDALTVALFLSHVLALMVLYAVARLSGGLATLPLYRYGATPILALDLLCLPLHVIGGGMTLLEAGRAGVREGRASQTALRWALVGYTGPAVLVFLTWATCLRKTPDTQWQWILSALVWRSHALLYALLFPVLPLLQRCRPWITAFVIGLAPVCQAMAMATVSPRALRMIGDTRADLAARWRAARLPTPVPPPKVEVTFDHVRRDEAGLLIAGSISVFPAGAYDVELIFDEDARERTVGAIGPTRLKIDWREVGPRDRARFPGGRPSLFHAEWDHWRADRNPHGEVLVVVRDARTAQPLHTAVRAVR